MMTLRKEKLMDTQLEQNEELEDISIEKESAGYPGESKSDKFKRIGERRINNALTAISRLEALSGNGYEYTEEQVEAMFGTLQSALDNAHKMFQKKEKGTTVFKF